jgi:hypothetical protein
MFEQAMTRRMLRDTTSYHGSGCGISLQIGRAGSFHVFVGVAAGLALILVESVAAQSRPDTTRMSCAAARALVLRHGAIVLSTGPSTFDVYVSTMSTRYSKPAFVPTLDNRQCFIGYEAGPAHW